MKVVGSFDSAKRWLPAALLAVLAAALYAPLVSSQVGHSGDTAQFQFVGHLPGLPHAPGAPVYVLAHYLFWRLLPWSTPALAANLLSALCGLATLLALSTLLRRLAIGTVAATLAVISLAVAPLFWRHAVVAELYVPGLLLTILSLDRALCWRLNGRRADLLGAAALLALSLGIHPTAVTALPAMLLLVFGGGVGVLRRPVFWWSVALGCLLIVLEFTFVVALALNPRTAFVWAELESPGDFVAYFTAADQRAQIPAASLAKGLTELLPIYLQQLGRSLGWLTPLAVLGVLAARRRPAHHLASLLLLGNLIYVLAFPALDAWDFMLQAVLAVTIFLALGLDVLLKWLQRNLSPANAVTAVTVSVLAVLVIQTAERHRQVAGRVLDTFWAERALSRLDSTAPGPAVIASPSWEETTVTLYYLFLPDEPYPGVDLVQAPTLPQLLAYLRGEEGLEVSFRRRRLPPGRRLFVIGERSADQLSRRGCHVYAFAKDFHLVTLAHDPELLRPGDEMAPRHRAPGDLWFSYGNGWGPLEAWGRWALAEEVELEVVNLPPAAVLRLQASLWEEAEAEQRVQVLLDGREVGVIDVVGEAWQPTGYELALGNEDLRAEATITLRFERRWPAGYGTQQRLRSLAVMDLIIDRTSK